MSALAQHLLACGKTVSGSDLLENDRTVALKRRGVDVKTGHNASNVDGAELVVHSSAVGESNVELAECKRLGIKTVLREQLLGAIFNGYESRIAVCGTHGKTTSSALVDHVFAYCNKDHVSFLGGVSGGNNYKNGNGTVVAEACEYRESFLNLFPTVCTCLNIEYDHPDYYANYDAVKSAFGRFFAQIDGNGTLIVNTSVPKECYENVSANVVTFGNGGDFCAENVAFDEQGKLSFDLLINGQKRTRILTNLRGLYNVDNVLSAIATCQCVGLPIERIAAAVKTFQTVDRRYKTVAIKPFEVIEDYAHHPSQVRSAVLTAKSNCKGKLYVVFQPHTFSRLKAMWTDFCTSFDLADEVLLVPVYPAREKPIVNVTSRLLCQNLRQRGLFSVHFNAFDDVYKYLTASCKNGDTVLILGAGDVYLLTDMFRK